MSRRTESSAIFDDNCAATLVGSTGEDRQQFGEAVADVEVVLSCPLRSENAKDMELTRFRRDRIVLEKEATMGGKTRPPYSAEFRRQIMGLVRAGRTPEELAEAFEPSAASIRHWVAQAEIDTGQRAGLSTAERAELQRLRRENKQLRIERKILSKAAA